MLFLTLDCGWEVHLDSFRYSHTYGGLLEGHPNARINANIIKYALSSIEKAWGKRATHVIPPIIKEPAPGHQELPPVLLAAWLSAFQPIDPEYMGSNLIVMWFAEECHSTPLQDIVFNAVRGLPWEKLAEDFNY